MKLKYRVQQKANTKEHTTECVCILKMRAIDNCLKIYTTPQRMWFIFTRKEGQYKHYKRGGKGKGLQLNHKHPQHSHHNALLFRFRFLLRGACVLPTGPGNLRLIPSIRHYSMKIRHR